MAPVWDSGSAPDVRHMHIAIFFAQGFAPTRFLLNSLVYKVFSYRNSYSCLHDASDVFLEAANVFKYSEKEMGASLCFGCFAISWLLLRLIFFPFWMIRTSSYYIIDSLIQSGSFPRTLYYSFNTMLFTLLVFHIYWWKLICAMILRQLHNQGKVGEDIRLDSEDVE